MGIYQHYIGRGLTPEQLEQERKGFLKKIGDILSTEVLTYAARLSSLPLPLPIGVAYEDLLPFGDLLEDLKGKRITVILETPGGIGEVGRQMVEMLHARFDHVAFLIPGWAKSTGTIMALGGHEILMGPGSALGPIDAQILQDGKQFSADALIEGLDRIKKEVEETKKLNAAYIPILQKISPGEIQNAVNALEFARVTVRDWLVKYKFSDWKTHQSTGATVTEDEKIKRAYEISTALSSQAKWYTHGRSIGITDLRDLRLQITDFSKDQNLFDAVQRYYVLLRMRIETTNTFKVFETIGAQVFNQFNVQQVALPVPAQLPVPTKP